MNTKIVIKGTIVDVEFGLVNRLLVQCDGSCQPAYLVTDLHWLMKEKQNQNWAHQRGWMF